MGRSHAYFDNLNAQLIVEVAYVEHVGPEAFSRGEWVHSDARTHLLEVASKLGVLPDLLLVLSCKSF